MLPERWPRPVSLVTTEAQPRAFPSPILSKEPAHPDPLPHASPAQPVRPPPGVFAHRDFREGPLFDRLGVSAALAATGTPFTIFPMMIAFGILWASG